MESAHRFAHARIVTFAKQKAKSSLRRAGDCVVHQGGAKIRDVRARARARLPSGRRRSAGKSPRPGSGRNPMAIFRPTRDRAWAFINSAAARAIPVTRAKTAKSVGHRNEIDAEAREVQVGRCHPNARTFSMRVRLVAHSSWRWSDVGCPTWSDDEPGDRHGHFLRRSVRERSRIRTPWIARTAWSKEALLHTNQVSPRTIHEPSGFRRRWLTSR